MNSNPLGICAKNIMKVSMNTKKDESVLIVTDIGIPSEISDALFKASIDIGCELVMIMKMSPRKVSGQEPPKAVAEAMKMADIILLPTSRSLTHTQARIDATKKGARIVSMPSITKEMMLKGGMTADYSMVSKAAKKLFQKIQGSKEVRITTELGTDLTMDVKGGKWYVDDGICHKPGTTINLPSGEVFIAPTNSRGIVVIDGTMSGISSDEYPIIMKIKNNYAVEISSEKLRKLVNKVGKKGRNIAEFGIGINEKATLIGNPLEDEKVKGTVHIALGDNIGFGGKTKVDLHLDGIITSPMLYIDNELLDLNGEY